MADPLTEVDKAVPEAASPPEQTHGWDTEFDYGQAPGTGKLFFREVAHAVRPLRSSPAAAAIASGSRVAEEFRVLAAKLRALDAQQPTRCVGVVSASGGEGKTTLALGLATALAQDVQRNVLLVEADLRKPSIERTLGLPNVDGLSECLEALPGIVVVRRLMPQRFCLLAGGRGGLKNPELLGSNRMERLLQAARKFFDYVIVDCAPLVPVADSVLLQDLLDGFLFVVRVRHTPADVIVKALSHVKPDRIKGVVVNDQRELLRTYGYGYRSY